MKFASISVHMYAMFCFINQEKEVKSYFLQGI